jgi:hypothetical protein
MLLVLNNNLAYTSSLVRNHNKLYIFPAACVGEPHIFQVFAAVQMSCRSSCPVVQVYNWGGI